ncbi:MAG: hypothetical protein AB7R69_01400 [Candidatus Babeliales bacterium]
MKKQIKLFGVFIPLFVVAGILLIQSFTHHLQKVGIKQQEQKEQTKEIETDKKQNGENNENTIQKES